MTPKDMERDAKEAVNEGTSMVLVIPRGFKKPPKFPRGEFLSENFDGSKCYKYDPKKVLGWLVDMNLTSK